MWNTKFRRVPAQLRISVIAVLAAVLPCYAQQASAPEKEDALLSRDVLVLMQSMSKGGSPEMEARIMVALKTIRAQFPEIAKIHAHPAHALDSLFLALTKEGQQIIERKVKMTDDSRRDEPIAGDTGIRGLDELNAKYGVKSISAFFSTGFLLVKFRKPMNIAALSEVYRVVPEVQAVEGNQILGGGDEIQLKQDNQVWLFTFKHGWGDCPSGCITKHYYFFSYRPDTQAVTKTGEERHVVEGLEAEDPVPVTQ